MARVGIHVLLCLAAFATAPAAGGAPPSKEGFPAAAVESKRKADALAREGRFDEAARGYREALRIAPAYFPALEGLGNVFFARGMYGPAADQFRRALRIEPGYVAGYYNLAYALRKGGKYAQAVDAYRDYLQRRPSDPDAHFGLAESYKALGKSKDAIRHFEEYVRMEKRASEAPWVEKARQEIARLSASRASPPLPPAGTVRPDATPPPRAAQLPGAPPAIPDPRARRPQERRAPDRPPSAAVPAVPSVPPLPHAAVPPLPPPRVASPSRAEVLPRVPPLPPAGEAPLPPLPRGDRRSARQLLRAGDAAFRRRAYLQALTEYRLALRRRPESARILNKLGLTFLRLQRFALAAQAFERVLALRPGYPGARTNLEYSRGRLRR